MAMMMKHGGLRNTKIKMKDLGTLVLAPQIGISRTHEPKFELTFI